MHSITESALCITSYVSYIWLSHLIQFKLAELTFKNFLGQASYLLGRRWPDLEGRGALCIAAVRPSVTARSGRLHYGLSKGRCIL